MALDYNAMAQAMEAALDQFWYSEKGKHLPETGSEDRGLLFQAIARGMLHYLEAQQDNFINGMRLRRHGYTGQIDYDVITLDLNIPSEI